MVLFHMRTRELMALNSTAALVWECCDGAHSVAMIADEVRTIFPDSAAEDDIALLVHDLKRREMVIGRTDAATPSPSENGRSATSVSRIDPVTAISICYHINGYDAVVTTPNSEICATVGRIFAGFIIVADLPEGTTHYHLHQDGAWWVLSVSDEEMYASPILLDALVALEWRLITDMITHRSDRFHLHGAALRTPDGAASILILGESGSGKTTLTLALMARGFLPYADDTSLIEPQGLAPETLRRAFHIDEKTRTLITANRCPSDWKFDAMPPGYFMPPRWADTPAPIRSVFLPTLQIGQSPDATPLALTDAVLRIVTFSATLDQSPAHALAQAAHLAECADCFVLGVGDLAETAALVAHLVNDSARADPVSR